MFVTVAQLEALFWTARLGGVGRAAAHLNLTQSTVSLRLRDLSEAVGTPLFRKTGRQLTLTPEGENVLEHVSIVIDELEKLRERVRPGEIGGVVRLGVSEAVALAGLHHILAELSRRYPKLRTEMTINTSIDLERDLLAGKLDLVLAVNIREDPRLKIVQLGLQQSGWVSSPALGLPDKVHPRDLAHLPVICNPAPSPMYEQMINWFRQGAVSPRQVSICNSITVIARLVASGIGVSNMPLRLVDKEIESGAMVVLESEFKLDESRMSAAYRSDDRRKSIAVVLDVSQTVVNRLEWLA